jgi:hypothetical protein
MAFDSVVRLISGGTNYYLSGSATTYYTGSGSPWTAENTSPYKLSNNDQTPTWVPQPSPGQMIYGGGPPFTNGRRPLYRSRDNVVEQVGIQMYATSANNAILLKQQLQRILNTALFSVPCVLAIQSGSNTAYFEIYAGDVVETSSYLEEGSATQILIRATITWTRSFAGGLLSSGETLINSGSFVNTGTGGTDNIAAYGTGIGELINEGQPLNIKVALSSGTFFRRFYAATVYSRSYNTTGSGALTTSTEGAAVLGVFDVSAALVRQGLRGRVLVRGSSTANVQIRTQVFISDVSETPLYVSSWITPPTTGATVIDLGGFPLTSILRTLNVSTYQLRVVLEYRSANGSSATWTHTYAEYLLFYDFCRIEFPESGVMARSTSYLFLDSFSEQTDAVCLPHQRGRALSLLTAGNTPVQPTEVRGQLPRYFAGSSLYLAWLSNSYAHATADTASITVTHGPQWLTLRGNN